MDITRRLFIKSLAVKSAVAAGVRQGHALGPVALDDSPPARVATLVRVVLQPLNGLGREEVVLSSRSAQMHLHKAGPVGQAGVDQTGRGHALREQATGPRVQRNPLAGGLVFLVADGRVLTAG